MRKQDEPMNPNALRLHLSSVSSLLNRSQAINASARGAPAATEDTTQRPSDKHITHTNILGLSFSSLYLPLEPPATWHDVTWHDMKWRDIQDAADGKSQWPHHGEHVRERPCIRGRSRIKHYLCARLDPYLETRRTLRYAYVTSRHVTSSCYASRLSCRVV